MATPPGACDGEDCRHHGRLPRDVNPAISSDCQASRLMGNLVTMPHDRWEDSGLAYCGYSDGDHLIGIIQRN